MKKITNIGGINAFGVSLMRIKYLNGHKAVKYVSDTESNWMEWASEDAKSMLSESYTHLNPNQNIHYDVHHYLHSEIYCWWPSYR